MQFRNLEISDYDAVMALWRACAGVSLRDADSREGIERYLMRNPGLSFVALEGGQIIGTIMAGHDGKRGYIQHLAVADRWRKHGVATQLVANCLDALKSAGIVKSHVHVLGDNRAGRGFWLRRGWHHLAEIAMYSFVNGDNPDA